jgi:hypothetical protein
VEEVEVFQQQVVVVEQLIQAVEVEVVILLEVVAVQE